MLSSGRPFGGVFFEQFLDQSTGLEFIQSFDTETEAFMSEFLDHIFVQLAFCDDFQDQFLLFRRALPGIVGTRSHLPARLITIRVPIAVPVSIGFGRSVTVAVAIVVGQKPDVLNTIVHTILQNPV